MIEFLDHTADVAVRLTAPDEAGLLQEAARALLEIQLTETSRAAVRPQVRLPLELEAEDGEALLVDFLNELILRFDTERLLVAAVDIEEASLGCPARLRGHVLGESLDCMRHVAKTEVKAATFHDLKIRRNAEGWSADVVFDL